MRGHLKRRGKDSWAIVVDAGRVLDPATGLMRRKQKWISFRGTRKQAERRLTDIVGKSDRGEFVEPSKLTLVDYLRGWLERSVKPTRRPETHRVYTSMVEKHVATASIANVPLQQLRGSDLERFYADLFTPPTTETSTEAPKARPLAASSISVLHAMVHRALRKAVKDRLLSVSPAVDLERPRPKIQNQAARVHCWSAVEARRVIDAAKLASPQLAAFTFLALDTGARKKELRSLTWGDLDIETGALTIARQLDAAGEEGLVWGPTKTRKVRTITLNPETLAQLRKHKAHQAEVKLANRTSYKDLGLIFAMEPEDVRRKGDALGQPIATLSEARFQALVKAAGVKQIKFHGTRHTVATLSLEAGTPPHVVAAKLGHSVVELMKTYAHALPDMQRDAAARLGALLHG